MLVQREHLLVSDCELSPPFHPRKTRCCVACHLGCYRRLLTRLLLALVPLAQQFAQLQLPEPPHGVVAAIQAEGTAAVRFLGSLLQGFVSLRRMKAVPNSLVGTASFTAELLALSASGIFILSSRHRPTIFLLTAGTR